MYVAYVALVAIANLFIGFMLATIFGSPRQIVAALSRNGRLGNRSSDNHDSDGDLLTTEISAAPDAPADESAAAASTDTDPTKPRDTKRFEGTWTEVMADITDQAVNFETSLSALTSRLEANSKFTPEEASLIKQQALDATSHWLTQAGQVVDLLGTSLKSVPNGRGIVSQCERIMNEQLAQSETSQSNLTMMDLAANAADVPRFSQELKRLVESSAEMRERLTKIVAVAYQS